MTTTHETIRHCNGYQVVGPNGSIGRVEEIWLGEAGEPAGVAVELFDGRRVFLPAEGMEDVSSDDEAVVLRDGVRLLQLELPHLVVDPTHGPVSATWRTTGTPIDPTAPREGALPDRVVRPIWRDIAMLYAFLGTLVLGLIGVDYAVALLVTGYTPL